MDTNTRRIMLTHALFMQLFAYICDNGEFHSQWDGFVLVDYKNNPVRIESNCIWFADIDTAFICGAN